MKATTYAWANNLRNNDTTEIQNESQENVSEDISSETIVLIVQLIEKLIDLTISNSDRALQVTRKFLQEVDTI